MKTIIYIIISIFFCIETKAQSELWGMTQKGGLYGAGVIFKTDASGNNQTVEHNFYRVGAKRPLFSNLIQASNGKLYGLSSEGGIYNGGVLFQYDPLTDVYTTKFNFYGTYGGFPVGSLLQASDGKLYGLTSSGGVNLFSGVLFQYDPATDIFTKLFDFDDITTGKKPYGSLVQASDGNLYGMTAFGGTNGAGVIFQFNSVTQVFTKKIDFSGNLDGSTPYGSLSVSSNGLLYGMTSGGGANGSGVLFNYDPVGNVYTKKIDFAGTSNGSMPKGNLLQSSNGLQYGLTSTGGLHGKGVLFEYDAINNTLTKKIDFTTTDGGSAESTLIEYTDGTLYGTTQSGGVFNGGVLFQYNPVTTSYVKKLDFSDGAPRGSLLLAQDGKMYGMTNNGGEGEGTLFQFDPVTFNYSKKIDFYAAPDGAEPTGSLTMGTDGKLYGTASMGGSYNKGILFQFDPVTHTYTKKYDFKGGNDGSNPCGALIQATNGLFYGLTTLGGGSLGEIYQYDPVSGIYKKLQDLFDGNYPLGSLLQASNGKLYGMTYAGWPANNGTILEYDIPTDTCKVVHIFTGPEGKNPSGSLIQASDNMLYGVTELGGAYGTLFQYNPATGTCTLKYDFGMVATDGNFPINGVIEASPGKLFGLTSTGGANYKGVIYSYNIMNSTYNTEYEFSAPADGVSPISSLVKASDGNLYGMTPEGGLGGGVIFQFNPTTSVYAKKHDFSPYTGLKPYYTNLIEISGVIGIKENVNSKNVSLYPNPNNGSFTIDLISKSHITIINVLGETVLNQPMEIGKQNLDIQSQTAGVYFVIVTDAKGLSATQKIVVQK